ncbi:MAG: iron-only hydrogenase system regulator [Clostridiales bacterium 43-6]|nr:MAG: iron-only hydrogenase system regulator [Clostridiales bacterium 43-6]
MKRVAIISAILEQTDACQQSFNTVISSFKGLVKGRMGIPLQEEDMAVISIVVIGELDEINSLTGKLGKIPHVNVKTSISKKEV